MVGVVKIFNSLTIQGRKTAGRSALEKVIRPVSTSKTKNLTRATGMEAELEYDTSYLPRCDP